MELVSTKRVLNELRSPFVAVSLLESYMIYWSVYDVINSGSIVWFYGSLIMKYDNSLHH